MKKRLTRRLAVASIAVIGAVAIGGTALAGHVTGTVKSYTGCLVPKDGVIVKVREGDAPSAPCTGGMTMVHLSGGDITKISVTGALSGGGDSGEVTIGLKPEFTLPTGCAAGRVAEWNGSAWVCGIDDDTTYTKGTGLDLSGTTFSIDPDYRVKNTPDCSSGQFATGFDADGSIQCAAPASGGVQAFAVQANSLIQFGGTATIISKVLPPGKYLLSASVELVNEDDEDTASGFCSIPGYTTSGMEVGSGGAHQPRFGYSSTSSGDKLAEAGNMESLSLTSAIIHPGGAVELKCTELEADVDVHQAALTALKVDSLD